MVLYELEELDTKVIDKGATLRTEVGETFLELDDHCS